MSRCPIKTNKGTSCRNFVKKYGVCGVHHKLAYDGGEDPVCLKFIEEYAVIIREFESALNACGCGKFQSSLGFNLTRRPDPDSTDDPQLRRMFKVSREMDRCNLDTQKLVDNPYLICNIASGVSNAILDPTNPQTEHRRLQKNYVLAYL